MKIIKSLPTQSGTAFFDRYANLIHTLTKFGVIAQIITGVAEIGIIYSLIYPSFSDLFPSVSHPFSITGSLLAASLLQVGLKLVFPYSVRAILFKRFTGLDLPLSIAVFILTISLLSVSVLLSYKGSQDIIDVAIAPPTAKTTTAPDSIKAVTERQANATFTTDSATIETKYKGKLEATESSYDNQIATVEKWSKGKRATTLRAEKVTKLATLQSDKASEIEAKATERKTTINRATDRNDTERADIKTDNSEAKVKAEQRKGKYKNYVGYFTLFCYIFFLIAFILDEIYKKGAGIDTTPIPHQRHFAPSLFSELSEAVKARIDTTLRAVIYQFADKTKASPLPNALNSLYDFKADALKNVYQIETEPHETKVIKLPTKPLRIAAKQKDAMSKDASEISEPQKVRPIGFFKPKKEDATTDKSEDATSEKEGVHNALRSTRSESVKYVILKCANFDCGKDFERKTTFQKYCCEDCRKAGFKHRTGVDFDLEIKKKQRLKKK